MANQKLSPQRESRIRARIENANIAFEPLKRKIYSLRRLVAGDFSKALPDAPAAQDDAPKITPTLSDLCDFIVTDYTDIHSNRLLEAVKQITMQVAYVRPDIEFEDLDPQMSALNAAWVKRRTGRAPIGCGARSHMMRGLIDFLIGGVGWSHTCAKKGMPALVSADTLDMLWDRDATTFDDMAWAGCAYRLKKVECLSMFGAAAVKQFYQGDIAQLDDIVEVFFYYDTDSSDAGAFRAYYVCSGKVTGDPLASTPNPHYLEDEGVKTYFLPFHPMYFMQLPSCKDPIGIVEMMFPDQLALWGIETYKSVARDSGKPFWWMKTGSMTPESAEKFVAGDYGAVVDGQGEPPMPINGLQVPRDVSEDEVLRERRLQAASGTNPYAAGAPVAGVEFASEVREISSKSDLTIGFVSEDHAAWWVESVRGLLALGAIMDYSAQTLRIGGVELRFGATNPVAQYLKPNSDIVIAADKMAFRPRSQRIAEAMRTLDVALKLQAIFPKAAEKAFEAYLRADGEKDVASWMEIPAPPQAPPGMDPSMMDPSMMGGQADAMSSTA